MEEGVVTPISLKKRMPFFSQWQFQRNHSVGQWREGVGSPLVLASLANYLLMIPEVGKEPASEGESGLSFRRAAGRARARAGRRFEK